MCKARDECNFPPDSRDMIRLRNNVRKELKGLEEDLRELTRLHEKDLKTGKVPLVLATTTVVYFPIVERRSES